MPRLVGNVLVARAEFLTVKLTSIIGEQLCVRQIQLEFLFSSFHDVPSIFERISYARSRMEELGRFFVNGVLDRIVSECGLSNYGLPIELSNPILPIEARDQILFVNLAIG